MKSLLYILGLLLFAPILKLNAQVAAENFNDSKLPEGWQSTVNAGSCQWNTFTNNPPQGGNFESTALIFDDNLCGPNAKPSNVSIISAAYNVADVSPLLLSIEIGLNTEDLGEKLNLEVYDGSSWQLIDTFRGDYSPFLYEADVTEFANPNFKVRWTFDDNGAWSYYAGIDNFKLSQEKAPPTPPQSTCATAPTILPGTSTVETIRRGDPPPDCNRNGQARGGAWFKYTATRDGVATVSSLLPQNDMIDTRLHILKGTCGNLVCLASNDDIGSFSFFSEASFLITKGEQYYIVWDDYNENNGFDFSLTEAEETCVAGESIHIDFSDRQEFETCHRKLDIDDNGNSWTASAADFKMNKVITYFAQNGANQNTAKEDYLFSPKLTLDQNTIYTITFTFNGANSPSDLANETLEVLLADSQDASANMTSIYKKEGIIQEGGADEEYDMATRVTLQYQPKTTGAYYLTFKTTSPPPSAFLLLFDYSLEIKLGVDDLAIAKVVQFYDQRSQALHLETVQNLTGIKLYNMNGQLLLDKRLQGQRESIDLARFNNGIYVFIVETDMGLQRFKLLKR